MVFMSSSALDWMPILKGWFLKRSNTEQDVLMPLFEAIFEDLYEFWSIALIKKINVLQCMIIKQVIPNQFIRLGFSIYVCKRKANISM